MSTDTLSLGDIPDLSGFNEEVQPFEDGWYFGTINGSRTTTDRSGNERTFESSDSVSAKGDSRNIRLQVTIKRKADGRTMNLSQLVNYRPQDLSQEVVQQVAAQMAKTKEGGEWGELFRPFMTLQRLSKLQQVAGMRQFSRTDDGGLDLTPIFDKTAYFRVGPDDRNPQYKQIVDIRVTAPKTIQ